ncbi:MAG: ABC transporter ATP-binding protein [bacterium]|nr:ABC transporter ATP-binding protein [Acidimicrobiia bacterium]MCY4649505.1 ABC transporter ATP-binding protein [bacterium]
MPSALLEVEGLTVTFNVGREGFWGQRRRRLTAVDDISFSIKRGETFGLVGESGSGKTTTGRAILGKVPIASGRVRFAGRDITGMEGKERRSIRQNMQLIPQNPYGSLNPRMKVRDLVAEPLVVHQRFPSARRATERVVELLELTGMNPDDLYKYPHAFSGGQRQRIVIARALALNPDLIIADEPVSALDVSIQAQVVNLLQDLQRRLDLTYIFIAHDLAVVRHISHRIGIMYAGKLVEVANGEDVYRTPIHPYTEALLSSVPIPDPRIERDRAAKVIPGEPPDPMQPPPGCRFHARCPLVQKRCIEEAPPLEVKKPEHQAACWLR